MRKLLVLVPFLASAAVTVKSVQTTPTQAVIEYTAPSGSGCTLEVSESASYSPVVHDVDTTLFSGSNADSRSGNMTVGLARTFVVGQRTSTKASDNKLYSRALQANTQHYYRITCGGDTAMGTFTTANISLGATHVEPPPFNTDGFGNYAWPTIDWTNQSKNYVDPLTGVLVKLSYPLPGRSNASLYGTPTDDAFTYYNDINSAWTNPANILNKSTSGPFASYSGASQDPIFLAIDTTYDGWTVSWGNVIDDVMLSLYGSGDDATAANRTMLACLSIDSQTCESSEIELVLPQTTAAKVTGPSAFPKIQFNGWTVGRFLTRNEISTKHGTVNVSGTAVTLAATDYAYMYFDPTWRAGSKIYIAGSSCTNNLCTIASVQSARSLTLSESAGTLTGAAYKSAAWGIRLRKKTTTGTVSLNSSYTYAQSKMSGMPYNGVADFCSKLTTTVSYAADGVTPITPVHGRLCTLQGHQAGESLLILLLEDTGEVRALSDFFYNSGWQLVPYGSFSTTDALTIYVAGYDNTGSYPKHALYRVQYDAETGKFKHWAGDNYRLTSPRPADYLTWTNLTPGTSSKTVEDQVAASITSNPFYKTAMGSSASFVGVVGNYAVYSLGFGGVQNSPCFVIRFDLTTGNLIQIADTMGGSSTTGRWGGCHTVQADGADDWLMVGASLLSGQSTSSYMNGPFETAVTSVYKGGAWNSNTSLTSSDFYACTAGNPYESKGATGNNCLKIRIPHEPCSSYPTTSELADYPCPWDATKSMPQTLQPGDYLWMVSPDRFFNGKYEKLLVLSKTDIGSGAFELETMRAATCRGVPYYDGESERTHANGWFVAMSGTGLCAGNGWWISATGPTWYPEDGNLTNQHGTFGSGLTPGQYTMTSAGSSSRFSRAMPDQIGLPRDYAQAQSTSSFGGVSLTAGVDVQSYQNKGQWTAPVSEQGWALDVRHYNPSGGYGGELTSGVWSQTYSLVSGMSQTYKIDIYGGQTSGKIFPFVAWAGYNLLQDKSGPSSLITDSDTWKYCVARVAGECRPGSAIGDAYVNVPKATTSTYCIVNQYSEQYPCLTNSYWFAAWGEQLAVDRDDPYNRYVRRLTMGFTGPGRQYQFKNTHVTPSGKWAFIETGWIDGVRDEMMMMKMLPWPAKDSAARDYFTMLPVSLGVGTSKARIKFGYNSSFYCTSRAEACVTDGSVAPFAFAQTDSLTPTTCSSGCTINIPALPGRILYYQIERLNDSGVIMNTSNVQVVAVN